jgi:hypothetical protein
LSAVAQAAEEKAGGGQPSRTKSLFTATAAGVAVAVFVYRILRS